MLENFMHMNADEQHAVETCGPLEADPNGKKPNEAGAKLDASKLHEVFSNVQAVPDDRFIVYRVLDQYGSEAGMISHLGGYEWRAYVDNFPGQKRFFSWNLPALTLAEFEADVKRTGLHLVSSTFISPDRRGLSHSVSTLAATFEASMTAARTLYLAGPMTGLPDHNYPAFNAAAARLREAGYEVVNPAELGLPDGLLWIEYMRAGITAMMAAKCNGVAVLPGWENSDGAKTEASLAFRLRMPVKTAGYWEWLAAPTTNRNGKWINL